jgi:hypothetical protein
MKIINIRSNIVTFKKSEISLKLKRKWKFLKIWKFENFLEFHKSENYKNR